VTESISAEEYNAIATKPKRNKYGNVPTERGGIVFHSKAEAERYTDLMTMQRAGIIRDLELQPKFRCAVNDIWLCNYSADFAYFDVEREERVVEDVKGGQSTAVYRLKKRLVEALHDVTIREIRKGDER
jgi:hypothetical protein